MAELGRFALQCLLGRHAWQPHPRFTVRSVRRCERCGRVEANWYGTHWEWRRVEHLEAETNA